MAEIYNRKSTLYSQKQSVRDELSASLYLESAGDDLIRNLAKNQTNTRISLQEQLEIVQNFEKGFELNPDDRKGIISLSDFKNHLLAVQENSASASSSKDERKILNLDEMMKITGLSRQELELALCEKPNSTISQLYMFAITNKKQLGKREAAEYKLPNHPINHLKEIEEEYFGSKKKRKCGSKPPVSDVNQQSAKKRKAKKKKKQRKRKKKNTTDNTLKQRPPKLGLLEKETLPEEKKCSETSKPSRPSLWDVKDMKSWSEPKIIGCKPQTFYVIKNSKIIKLEKEAGSEDTT